MAHQRGDGERHPAVPNQADDPAPELDDGEVPPVDGSAAEEAPERRHPPRGREADPPGVLLAAQDQGEDDDGAGEPGQPGDCRHQPATTRLPEHDQEGDRQDRGAELQEVVPDPRDHHRHRDPGLGEPPGGEDPVGQADRHRAAGGHGVRYGRRRLRDDDALREGDARGGDEDDEAVGRQVPHRDDRQHRELTPGERPDGRPHLGDVGELAQDVPDHGRHEDDGDGDLQHLLGGRVPPAVTTCGRAAVRGLGQRPRVGGLGSRPLRLSHRFTVPAV